jgi:GYF domain 2
MAKNYYCKIKDKTFGPMTLEALKKLATEGKLQPSDKVASDISPEFLLAGSVSFLNEIFKTYNEETRSEFSQEANLGLLAKNSIETVRLLEAIKGWVTFMGIVLVIYIFLSIFLALVMNPAITPRR